MDSYETNFLPFFLVTRTLIFSEQMIIVDVVNILFYFSVIRDSLKEIGVMRDRSPPLYHPAIHTSPLPKRASYVQFVLMKFTFTSLFLVTDPY